jgi:hypothetical protein
MLRLVPLRLSTERAWLYGAVLVLFVSVPYIWLPWFHDVAYRGDFANFWSAGATAGTPILTDRSRLAAWQIAHHLMPQTFVYPPPFAWFYWPFSHLSPMAGMFVQDVCMLALFAAAGVIAARTFGFNPWFSIAAVLGWTPSINSVEVGQNTGLALLLVVAAIWALVEERAVAAGVAIGLLFYKPTIAIPLLLLLLARKQWKALAVSALCGAGWYLAGVATTHGEWLWPLQYARELYALRQTELEMLPIKAITVPELLANAGLNQGLAAGFGYLLLMFTLPIVARRSMLEGACLITLVGLATNPHANPYELALMLPAIFYAMLELPEPHRTRIIATLYVLVTASLCVPHAWPLAPLILIAGAGAFVAFSYRRLSGRRSALPSGCG